MNVVGPPGSPRHPQLSWPQGLDDRCSLCPRLVEFRSSRGVEGRNVVHGYPYWNRPVPDMGDPNAWLLVVGLAPGANGANRTGRPFTGDAAGALLFRALYDAGLVSCPDPEAENPQVLLDGVMVTNVARCVPEKDKLKPEEIANCRQFFHATINSYAPTVTDILCIGKTRPFPEVKRYLGLFRKRGAPKFRSDDFFRSGRYRVWMSYHTSQRNTRGMKISQESFTALVRKIVEEKNRTAY